MVNMTRDEPTENQMEGSRDQQDSVRDTRPLKAGGTRDPGISEHVSKNRQCATDIRKARRRTRHVDRVVLFASPLSHTPQTWPGVTDVQMRRGSEGVPSGTLWVQKVTSWSNLLAPFTERTRFTESFQAHATTERSTVLAVTMTNLSVLVTECVAPRIPSPMEKRRVEQVTGSEHTNAHSTQREQCGAEQTNRPPCCPRRRAR